MTRLLAWIERRHHRRTVRWNTNHRRAAVTTVQPNRSKP